MEWIKEIFKEREGALIRPGDIILKTVPVLELGPSNVYKKIGFLFFKFHCPEWKFFLKLLADCKQLSVLKHQRMVFFPQHYLF